MKKLFIGALTAAAALAMSVVPAGAAHEHFVIIDNPADGTRTCQYIGSGQTSISDPAHGGYHRIHHNVHTGEPGEDERGTDFDKATPSSLQDCDVIRR